MCQILVQTNPLSYEATTRSIRLHGVVTSVRLENLFWDTLEQMAALQDTSVPLLLSTLHDELVDYRGEIPNYASFLRVCCLRHIALRSTVPAD